MKAGKSFLTAAGLLLIFLLSACGRKEETEWIPTDTSLIAGQDGTLTEMIFDQLDRSYYRASELNEQVLELVKAYNADHPDAIVMDEMTEEGNRIVLTLHYKSWEDYTAFNQIPAYNGSVLEAELAGFRFQGDFYRVKDGKVQGGKVGYEEALSHKEYQVMIADASYTVSVPNDIVYISANAAPLGEREAKASRHETESEEATSGDELPSEDQNDGGLALGKDLVFVLYDYD